MDDLKDYWLWGQGIKCYEQLRVVDDINKYGSWALGSRCYEQLRIIDDMNDLGSWALDFVNNSEVRMTWMTLIHHLR